MNIKQILFQITFLGFIASFPLAGVDRHTLACSYKFKFPATDGNCFIPREIVATKIQETERSSEKTITNYTYLMSQRGNDKGTCRCVLIFTEENFYPNNNSKLFIMLSKSALDRTSAKSDLMG